MRPIAQTQDSLHCPLNEILGTEAQVRIIRILSRSNARPMTASELSRRTGLSSPGNRKSLAKLVRMGLVVVSGEGRSLRYVLNPRAPFVEQLSDLFRAEREHHDGLIGELRRVVQLISPPAISAWLEFTNSFGEPLNISVIHESRALTAYLRRLRSFVTDIEQEFEVFIEVSGYTRADVPSVFPPEILLLDGVLPEGATPDSSETNDLRTHGDHDRRSFGRAKAIANLVRSDPSLIERAHEHLSRLLQEDHGLARSDLVEWSEILRTYSLPRLLRFLTAASARADRLRQSSPFLAVLTREERESLFKSTGDAP